MKLKTFIASDFHIDFWDSDLSDKETVFKLLKIKETDNFDLIILAGDIGQCHNSTAKGKYISFIRHMCSFSCPVILIKGNHENYQNQLTDSKFFCKSIQQELFSNLYFLEKEYIDLFIKDKPVRIYGATLWTNFNNAEPMAMLEAKLKMNDFGKMILKPGYRKFLPEDAFVEFDQSWQRLISASQGLRKDQAFIVVTHHAPLQKFVDNFRKLRNWKPEIELLDYSYFSDCSKMFKDLQRKPKYWISGHIHSPIEFEEQGIKFISNPYGYEEKYEKRLYENPIKELEV